MTKKFLVDHRLLEIMKEALDDGLKISPNSVLHDRLSAELEQPQVHIPDAGTSFHPAGATLLPVELTPEMLKAGVEATERCKQRSFKGAVQWDYVFRAMLAAAPQPPSRQSEPTDSMGIPLSCGKPLCAPGQHHSLCVLASAPQPPVVEQPPVAWTVAGQVQNWERDFSAYRTKHYVRPVYTHPQPRRKPLTDEQINTIVTEQWGSRVVHAAHRAFARAIERAHGIGQEGGAA